MAQLQAKADKLLRQTYGKLTAWQKTLVARHPDRPHFGDYVDALIEDFTPLAGDRTFADDRAILGGLGRFRGRSVVVIGHEKGSDTAVACPPQFRHGPARGLSQGAAPDGHWPTASACRCVTLVDTPGAYPGVDAEARGQAEAIARAIETCLKIRVPLVAAIIGEGGSGGAIALAAANRVLMLEHAVYSVISPEGCASILWRSARTGEGSGRGAEADGAGSAEARRHRRDRARAAGRRPSRPRRDHRFPRRCDRAALTELCRHDGARLRAERREKFLAMGRKGLN